jgi:nitrite reductase/ring-hydroxylating ferredoxin subunit/catechol 2,3-dioxygenase-like lactoylglutathione lyase family enzyme
MTFGAAREGGMVLIGHGRRPGVGPVRAVTVSTADLAAARRLYEGLLGLRPLAEWTFGPSAADVAALWGLRPGSRGRAVWLEAMGASAGAVRLVEFDPPSDRIATDGARPYDHGLVKNLDFFTDDVEAAHARFRAAGHDFLAPPVTYPVGWGGSVHATEAHMKTADGVKIALAGLAGAPRKAFGEAAPSAPFTEVAAATQIVADYDRAVAFYRDVFDCVPAADTVIDDPGLVAALHLPPSTRLRACFIGPPLAVGGKVGLVAYEGDGVADARSLAEQCRPPHRGAVMLSFEAEDADHVHARALARGASEVAAPRDLTLPPWGRVRASSIRSPDGILHEIVQAASEEPDYRPLLPRGQVSDGTLRGARAHGWGRLAVAGYGGQVFAVEDRCPHLGGPLSTGALGGRFITCPWHGWRVDVTTGRVDGESGLGARVCPLRVRDGLVCAPASRQGDAGTPREDG